MHVVDLNFVAIFTELTLFFTLFLCPLSANRYIRGCLCFQNILRSVVRVNKKSAVISEYLNLTDERV